MSERQSEKAPLTVDVGAERRTWLVREAARRSIETGRRLSLGDVVRDAIDSGAAKSKLAEWARAAREVQRDGGAA